MTGVRSLDPRRLLASLDPLLLEMARGTALAFGLRVSGSALTFATNILVARLLGAAGTGVYFLAYTVSAITIVVGRVGLDNVMLRFASVAAAEQAWDRLDGLYRKGMLIASSAATALAAAVYIAAPLIATHVFHNSGIVLPLRVMMLAVPSVGIVYLHGEMFKALGRIRVAVLLQSVALPIVNIPLLGILASVYGVAGAAVSYAASGAVLLVIARALWRRAVPRHHRSPGAIETAVLVRIALPLFVVASLNLVTSWSDTLMLGMWADSQAVGIYAVASRTALLTSFVLVAANTVIAPRFSQAFAAGDHRRLALLARRAARLTSVLAAPLLLLLVATPGFVLSVFGPAFRSGGTALRILCAGQFVNAATGSVGYLLMMTGHERVVRNVVAVSAGTNIVGNAALIPLFGSVGAAVATASSIAIQNVGLLWQVHRRLSIRVW